LRKRNGAAVAIAPPLRICRVALLRQMAAYWRPLSFAAHNTSQMGVKRCADASVFARRDAPRHPVVDAHAAAKSAAAREVAEPSLTADSLSVEA